MSDVEPQAITLLLRQARDGDSGARERLVVPPGMLEVGVRCAWRVR